MTSPAIVLEVLPAPAADEASSAREIFIETDVAPEDVYVQSQLTYTVRIYRAVEFLEATLSDFATENAVTHRLGKDATYTRVIDGRPATGSSSAGSRCSRRPADGSSCPRSGSTRASPRKAPLRR